MRDEREAKARFLLGRLLADIYKDECAAELLRDAIYYMPDLVAAHVEIGIVYCRLERYEEMLEAFREAIRLDARAVRTVVRNEPAELEVVRQALYAERPEAVGAEGDRAVIPGYVWETWAMVSLAREHIEARKDEAALATLEAVLNRDETHQYAVALLALAYLLIKVDAGITVAKVDGGVLWKVEPVLAELLFKEWESTPSTSH